MIYVQYDPTTADANQHVFFSTVSIPDNPNGNPPAPQPPSNITQIPLPDGTQTIGMIIDLSQNPPSLIPIPPSPSPAG
jgi:hypothetical protein